MKVGEYRLLKLPNSRWNNLAVTVQAIGKANKNGIRPVLVKTLDNRHRFNVADSKLESIKR